MVCPRRVIDSVFRAVIDAFKLKIWAMAKLDEIASDDDVFEFGGEPCRHEPMLLSCSGGIRVFVGSGCHECDERHHRLVVSAAGEYG